MADQSHISEKLIHNTTRLLTFDANDVSTAGTGFFFEFDVGNQRVVHVIVTNRHMVSGKVRAELCLTHSDVNMRPIYGSYEHYNLINLQASVEYHPDQSVDLAAIYLGGIINDMQSKGRQPYHVVSKAIDLASLQDVSSMTSFEEVVMVGYPNGLWDATNNLPIARRGYTATPFARDYEGRKEFVIDAACFPGSSGSPIYLYSNGPFATPTGIALGPRCKLLGVLYAGPLRIERGRLEVVPLPAGQEIVPISQSPVHLGFCIKATEILKLAPAVNAKVALERVAAATESA